MWFLCRSGESLDIKHAIFPPSRLLQMADADIRRFAFGPSRHCCQPGGFIMTTFGHRGNRPAFIPGQVQGCCKDTTLRESARDSMMKRIKTTHDQAKHDGCLHTSNKRSLCTREWRVPIIVSLSRVCRSPPPVIEPHEYWHFFIRRAM